MGHLTIWEQLRIKGDELVAISMRPYHLPGVFFHITVMTVYCTSQPAANGDVVCEVLHAAVSRLQTQHPSGHADLWRLQLRGKIRDRKKLCRKNLAGAQETGPHPSAQSPKFRFLWGFSSTFNSIQPTLLSDKMEQVGIDHQLTSSVVYYLSNRDRGGERHTTVASQGFVEDVFVQRWLEVQAALLRSFYECEVASAIFYTVWLTCSILARDKRKTQWRR